jgi:hypothetical protein
MKRKNLVVIPLLTAMFLLVACGSGNTDSDNNTTPESDTSTPEENEQEENTQEDTEYISGDTIEERLSGLTKDEYEALEITAEVLERKAIIPGSTFPVNVTIKNNGDETIVYPHGSGSFDTPEALFLDAADLQPVLPKDQLGPAMTMDMRYNELSPGEELTFILYVRAIEPNSEFDTWTYDLYAESETYIGEVEWSDLQKDFPDLTAAEPGSYDVHVYFLYYVLSEDTQAEGNASVTGYAQSTLTISVTE